MINKPKTHCFGIDATSFIPRQYSWDYTGMNMSVENNTASPLPNKFKKGPTHVFRFFSKLLQDSLHNL